MMKDTLTFDFCTITIYDNYIVAVMKEGITVSPNYNDALLEISNSHYKNKPFVYITHRINSYAVDPKTYLETSKIENLKGFAVVSTDYKAKVNAQIEKMFYSKAFETFATLEEAIDWANELVKKETTS